MLSSPVSSQLICQLVFFSFRFLFFLFLFCKEYKLFYATNLMVSLLNKYKLCREHASQLSTLVANLSNHKHFEWRVNSLTSIYNKSLYSSLILNYSVYTLVGVCTSIRNSCTQIGCWPVTSTPQLTTPDLRPAIKFQKIKKCKTSWYILRKLWSGKFSHSSKWMKTITCPVFTIR